MSARPSPGPSQSAQPAAVRVKYVPGIQAGAQEEKYRQKARTLKKKIREIEADNDKVYAKTLQAKRNIQRLRIERAILYERLSGQPPSPRLSSYAPPSAQYQPPPPQPPQAPPARAPYPPTHEVQVDVGDAAAVEYYRSQNIPIRRVTGPDGHYIHVAEIPAHLSGPPVSQTGHSSRHASYRESRHHHAPTLPPSAPASQHHDPPRSHERHEHHRTHSASHPHSPTEIPASRSHSHSRSRSRGHRGHLSGYPPQAPLDTLPPSHHDPREYAPSERRTHEYVHEQAPVSRGRSPPAPYPQHPELSPTSPRGSSRVHNHQRLGPGTNINNIGQPELEGIRELRDRDRVREWEAERSRRTRERPPGSGHTRPPSPPYSVRDRDSYARGYESSYALPPDESMNGSRSRAPRSRSGSMHAADAPRYYEREYDQVRSTAPPARYAHSNQADIDAAETLHRVRSSSIGRVAEQYSSRGHSAESDVEME